MKKLKTAVLGTGFMGRVHTEGIRRVGNVEVAAIAASSEEKARKFADELGGERSTGDYRTLLKDTEWNWRIDSSANGRSRAFADIGTHWCDMIEHVTGLRITSVCADLQTFHKTRKRPKGSVETFAGKTSKPEDYDVVPIDTEDYAAVLLRLGDRTRGAFTVSQVSAGRKNRLAIEIYGTKGSAAWDQEKPDELWLGQRNSPNQVIVKDPSLLHEKARSYADLPGGHSEGYDDTFKQVFRRFYKTVADRSAPVEYAQFVDGLRQLQILDKVLESSS